VQIWLPKALTAGDFNLYSGRRASGNHSNKSQLAKYIQSSQVVSVESQR